MRLTPIPILVGHSSTTWNLVLVGATVTDSGKDALSSRSCPLLMSVFRPLLLCLVASTDRTLERLW